jgi:hypothetical protein
MNVFRLGGSVDNRTFDGPIIALGLHLQGNVVSLLKTLLALAMVTLGVVTSAFCQSAPATELLSSAEIRHSLVGKLIDYSPPGSADAGIVEAFHENGKW